jgi:UDP-N-acetylmuramate dehydrogenase
MISTEEIFRIIRGQVAVAEPLAPYTGLKIGGLADFLVKPADRANLCKAVRFFDARGLPYFILGKGTGVLVHDSGFRGAVIATQYLDRYSIDHEAVEAEAGVPLSVLAEKTFQGFLGGLELLQGIPGTVGGALYMNAEAFGQEISERLEWVDVMRNGRVRRLKKESVPFGCRPSGLRNDVILRAGFRLQKLTVREKQQRALSRADALERRTPALAEGISNAGSIFRNPLNGPSGQRGMSAGALMDECGLRGKRYGGASVSETHANIIVNNGGASSGDVLELIRFARGEVHSRHGIALDLEITLVGYQMKGCDGRFYPGK